MGVLDAECHECQAKTTNDAPPGLTPGTTNTEPDTLAPRKSKTRKTRDKRRETAELDDAFRDHLYAIGGGKVIPE